MAEDENVALVRQAFAALEKGDLPAFLGSLADDVEFRSPVTRHGIPEVPWSRPRHSPAGVAEFFGEMGGAMDVQPYEILDVCAAGDRVFVEGRNRGIVRATGRPYEHEWVMVITVRDGKVMRVYHYYDSAGLLPALRSE